MSLSTTNALNSNPTAIEIIATNEKITGPPGVAMLQNSLFATSETIEVMDNACGGGILTAELLNLTDQHHDSGNVKRIVVADIDESMISYMRRRCEASGWRNVEFVTANQQSMPIANEAFTHIYNNFGIFFCPDDEMALGETFRMLRPNGIAAFTSWKAIAWWSSFAIPAIQCFIPEAPALPDPITVLPAQGWTDSKFISMKLEKTGFQDIQVLEYAFSPNVEAGEFAEACASLVEVVRKKMWSEEENQRLGDRIKPAILSYLREHYADGNWNGKMTAMVSIAKKPSKE